MNESANSSLAELLQGAANQAKHNYGDLTLVALNATLAALVVDPGAVNLTVIAPVIGEFFAEGVFTAPLQCVYPISGQYGFLNRLLYYILIVFAIVSEHDNWLASAALGVAMSYATSASIHAFALLQHYQYATSNTSSESTVPTSFGDPDMLGIYPILVAGCTALPPILNWSYTIRRGSKGLKPVVFIWGVFMLAAVIPILFDSQDTPGSIYQWFNNFERLYYYTVGIDPFTVDNQVAYCLINESNRCTPDADDISVGISRQSTYNRCHCNDTCGAVSPDDAPMRKGTGLVAWLTSDQVTKLSGKSWFYVLSFINEAFLSLIIAHGVFSLIETWWSQTYVRNTVFRLLGGWARYRKKTNWRSKVRHWFGKLVAAWLFIAAVLAAIVCPPVFIGSIVCNEIIVRWIPQSEEQDAVGQWSTWVAAAFAVIAAIIQHQYDKWLEPLPSTSRNQSKSFADQRERIRSKLFPMYRGLIDFKYWFLEDSLHEQTNCNTLHDKEPRKITTSEPCYRCGKKSSYTQANQCVDCDRRYCSDCWPQKSQHGQIDVLHRTFRVIHKLGSCDGCGKDSDHIDMYQCVACDQRYCAFCWPKRKRRGARLETDLRLETGAHLETDDHADHHMERSSFELRLMPVSPTITLELGEAQRDEPSQDLTVREDVSLTAANAPLLSAPTKPRVTKAQHVKSDLSSGFLALESNARRKYTRVNSYDSMRPDKTR